MIPFAALGMIANNCILMLVTGDAADDRQNVMREEACACCVIAGLQRS